jgi:fructose-specific phosphotransferase system component IIB
MDLTKLTALIAVIVGGMSLSNFYLSNEMASMKNETTSAVLGNRDINVSNSARFSEEHTLIVQALNEIKQNQSLIRQNIENSETTLRIIENRKACISGAKN